MSVKKFKVTINELGNPDAMNRIVCDGALIVCAKNKEEEIRPYMVGQLPRWQTVRMAILMVCANMEEKDVPQLRNIIESTFDEAEKAMMLQKLEQEQKGKGK